MEKKLERDLCDCRIIHEERIEKAGETALSDSQLSRLSNHFKALGDPTRLKIVWALKHGEMCVCDLAAYLGISESAVSHQLRMLRQLQLVANRREGPVLYYHLSDEKTGELILSGLEKE
jgi:DNA-binding transcriptional ArsR family regulator